MYPKFLEHAPEIQNAIWQFSLPPARIIQLREARHRSNFFSNTMPPVALHVCYNSRPEALRTLTPLFQDDRNIYRRPQWSRNKRPIYVNLSLDIIYIAGDPPIERIHQLPRMYPDGRIESIAVDLVNREAWEIFRRVSQNRGGFSALKNLWIVVGRDDYKAPLDFRSGAYLGFQEMDATLAIRATDSNREFLGEWSNLKGHAAGLAGRSCTIRFVDVKLIKLEHVYEF